MSKYERGTSREFVTSISGVDVTSLSWKDNKVVNLVSTYVGMKPLLTRGQTESASSSSIKRFDKKDKTVKMISCPQIIKDYNRHLGGVDLLDSCLGRHKIAMKSRKWTNRIFYHLLDLTCATSWILYKRINKDRPEYKDIRLIDFKLQLADSLFNFKSVEPAKRGRPSLEPLLEEKRRKPNSSNAPSKDIRLDMTDHWTTMETKDVSIQTAQVKQECFVQNVK
ncbi:piggyBac transposable element-derived protein 3-like [Rhagoletis pomonella]|uniref:piggyBac transposable element-derived protein 3-like n=1 Tax=Rhagoletis pomonella TaxID=28610 RepID=UPI001781D093|nr:piggyBac transposable element-derived protein 3-like [Rhagoletis pomonella]